jgi:hypothetical protein
LHFFPFGLTPRPSKIFSRRATCPRVTSRCSVNAAFNSGAVAALAIRGSALRSWFSAL